MFHTLATKSPLINIFSSSNLWFYFSLAPFGFIAQTMPGVFSRLTFKPLDVNQRVEPMIKASGSTRIILNYRDASAESASDQLTIRVGSDELKEAFKQNKFVRLTSLIPGKGTSCPKGVPSPANPVIERPPDEGPLYGEEKAVAPSKPNHLIQERRADFKVSNSTTPPTMTISEAAKPPQLKPEAPQQRIVISKATFGPNNNNKPPSISVVKNQVPGPQSAISRFMYPPASGFFPHSFPGFPIHSSSLLTLGKSSLPASAPAPGPEVPPGPVHENSSYEVSVAILPRRHNS